MVRIHAPQPICTEGWVEKHISELQKIIIEHNLQETPDLQTQSQYLQHCADFGKDRAKLH